MDPAVQCVPGRRAGHLPGPQLVEGVALGRVTLAHVLGEGQDVAGVTAGQGFEGTAGADGVELAVVAHDDGPCPGGCYRTEQLGHFGVGGHAALVQDEHVAGARAWRWCSRRQVSEATVRELTPAPSSEGFGRLARGGGPDDGVAGGFEAGPHGRKSRGLPAAGHPDQQGRASARK